MKSAGLIERLAGHWSGALLAVAAARAKRRGDAHEFNHCRAAVIAGNTGPRSHDRGCLAIGVLNRWDASRS